ncbi:MAG: ComF family protein [Burkholderiales bacterium]
MATWIYAFPIDKLIHAFKFQHRLDLAPWFATALAKKLSLSGPLIVAMPLHRSRLAERGFNQALEISRHLAAATGGNLLHDIVDRPIAAQLQAGMRLRERAKNVRNTFRCLGSLSGQSVVVIDDVMTTGATLNELARILKLAGACKVTNLVVARTLPMEDYLVGATRRQVQTR